MAITMHWTTQEHLHKFSTNDLWFLESLEVGYPCFVRLLPDISLAGELHRRLCLWKARFHGCFERMSVSTSWFQKIATVSACNITIYKPPFTMILMVLHHLLGWKSRILSKSLFWLPKNTCLSVKGLFSTNLQTCADIPTGGWRPSSHW